LFEKMAREVEERQTQEAEMKRLEENTQHVVQEAAECREMKCQELADMQASIIDSLQTDVKAQCAALLDQLLIAQITDSDFAVHVKKINEDRDPQIQELEMGVQDEQIEDYEMEVDVPRSVDALAPPGAQIAQ
jgi:hypothetical protein